jgi:hypothetical protein
VPLSMCRWRASADDVLQRHRTPSQAEPTSTPETIQDQQSSGGPSEKYQCTGARPDSRSGSHMATQATASSRSAVEKILVSPGVIQPKRPVR